MIYMIGDLHGDINSPGLKRIKDFLWEDDILIVLGDFGFDWDEETLATYNINCTTLFVPGNHENYDILKKCKSKKMFDDSVGVLKDKVYFTKHGHMYNIEGLKFFAFGGANSIDKQWRVPHKSWWEDEIPTTKDYNYALNTLKKNNYTFDYFISHTCSSVEKQIMFSYDDSASSRFIDNTEYMIRDMMQLIEDNKGSFKYHMFGHFHRNLINPSLKCMCLYEQPIELIRNQFQLLSLYNSSDEAE